MIAFSMQMVASETFSQVNPYRSTKSQTMYFIWLIVEENLMKSLC